MSQGSQQNQLFVTSNRRTPSTTRHIHSLPSELLRHIFWCYCKRNYGPLPLLLVCRLWHAIASDYSALWGNISYIPNKHHYRIIKSVADDQMRKTPIFCDTWAKLQGAVKRTRTAPLNLHIGFFDPYELNERQGPNRPFLTRCRELSLDSPRSAGAVVAFRNDLPALEHLEFRKFDETELDRLFNDIEKGSPLLWSLKLCGMWSIAYLGHLPTLSRRIRCLDVNFNSGEDDDQFIVGLQNLTELTVRSRSSLRIPRGAFPKLLSLTIWDTQLVFDETMEFPVLDQLTLHEDWSSLPLIVAPKLTKLILRCEEKPNIPLAILLRATVRPISLVLSGASLVIDLPELLTMWSGLLELHLEYNREVNAMSQVSLATLGGSSDHGRLCPHLRYLTVHVNKGQRDSMVTGQIIQTLHTIVEERRRLDTNDLRRVMCVWENWDAFDTGHPDQSKEIEWVDVL